MLKTSFENYEWNCFLALGTWRFVENETISTLRRMRSFCPLCSSIFLLSPIVLVLSLSAIVLLCAGCLALRCLLHPFSANAIGCVSFLPFSWPFG